MAREHGFRAVFLNPDDIGGRYSALSYFGLVPAALIGAPLHEVLDRAEEMQTASERDGPRGPDPRRHARRADGRGGQGRPRQAHARAARGDRELRQLGRAADRRVDRQGGPRHRARGRRTARPARRLRPGPGLRRDRRARRARRARERRPPGRPAAVRRPRADRRRVLPLGDGHGGRGLRARHQPVRPAERAGGQGRDEGDPRLGLGRGPGVRRPRRAPEGGDRGRLRGDPRLPGPDLRDRGRDRTRPPRDPRPVQGGDHDRVRPAVPALDRAAPQGRGRTTASSSRWWTRGVRWTCRSPASRTRSEP